MAPRLLTALTNTITPTRTVTPSGQRAAPTGPAGDTTGWIPTNTDPVTVAPPSAPSGGGSRVGEYCTTGAGQAGTIQERFGLGGSLGYVCVASGGPVQSTPAAAPSACPAGESMLGAGSLRYYADGSTIRNTGSSAACFPDTPPGGGAAAPTTPVGTPAAPGSPTPGPAPGSGGSDGGDSINRLIDLMAAQFASAGTSGGGSGFGGLVSAPVGDGTSATITTAAAGPNRAVVFVMLLVAGGLAYWYYKKHKRAA